MQVIISSIHKLLNAHIYAFGVFVTLFAFVFFAGGLVVANGQSVGPSDSHVVNLNVDGTQRIVPTRAETVEELLQKAGVTISQNDLVEPALKTEIVDDNFNVHVYRAQPVTIIDGDTATRVMTPHSSPRLIAEKAGITAYPEDILEFSASDNFVSEKILGQKLTIDRANAVTLSLYGAPAVTYRTHSETIGDLLKEKGIVAEAGATITPNESTKLTPNTAIFISKYGKQIVTKEEEVAFPIESTPDPTQPNGKITVTAVGKKGKKQVVYEAVMRDGKEVSKNIIQEVVTLAPQKQVQTMGTKPGSGLSKSKGVMTYIDSRGVAHRETYYDLPMSRVMNNCGAGGQYSVRADGAKVDKDGHVIIAANLNNYPRCSIVETSIGSGKVYDTGGFALVHPHGFDLATDWSNNDGR